MSESMIPSPESVTVGMIEGLIAAAAKIHVRNMDHPDIRRALDQLTNDSNMLALLGVAYLGPRLSLQTRPVATYVGVDMSRYTLEWVDGPLTEGTQFYVLPPIEPIYRSQEFLGLVHKIRVAPTVPALDMARSALLAYFKRQEKCRECGGEGGKEVSQSSTHYTWVPCPVCSPLSEADRPCTHPPGATSCNLCDWKPMPPQAALSSLDTYDIALNTRHPASHAAVDAFWTYWKANGETHKHGYYESTWGAINQALRLIGVVDYDTDEPPATKVPERVFSGELPPTRLVSAAMEIGKWFADRNVTTWSLGPCANRPLPDDNQEHARRSFKAALQRASDEVSTWPEWKRRPGTAEENTTMDMPIPCDIKIGTKLLPKGTPLRELVILAQTLLDSFEGLITLTGSAKPLTKVTKWESYPLYADLPKLGNPNTGYYVQATKGSYLWIDGTYLVVSGTAGLGAGASSSGDRTVIEGCQGIDWIGKIKHTETYDRFADLPATGNDETAYKVTESASAYFWINGRYVQFAVDATRTFDTNKSSQVAPQHPGLSVQEVDFAYKFITEVHKYGVPIPTMMFGDDGTVGMYWDTGADYFDAEVAKGGASISLFRRNRKTMAELWVAQATLNSSLAYDVSESWVHFHLKALIPKPLPEAVNSEYVGEVVISKNERGEIIAVTRQDEDGRILKILAKPGLTSEQVQSFAVANAAFPRKVEVQYPSRQQEFLTKLADLMGNFNASIYYTTADDGVHIALGGLAPAPIAPHRVEVFKGFLDDPQLVSQHLRYAAAGFSLKPKS